MYCELQNYSLYIYNTWLTEKSAVKFWTESVQLNYVYGWSWGTAINADTEYK